jgi:hypothetical protein
MLLIPPKSCGPIHRDLQLPTYPNSIIKKKKKKKKNLESTNNEPNFISNPNPQIPVGKSTNLTKKFHTHHLNPEIRTLTNPNPHRDPKERSILHQIDRPQNLTSKIVQDIPPSNPNPLPRRTNSNKRSNKKNGPRKMISPSRLQRLDLRLHLQGRGRFLIHRHGRAEDRGWVARVRYGCDWVRSHFASSSRERSGVGEKSWLKRNRETGRDSSGEAGIYRRCCDPSYPRKYLGFQCSRPVHRFVPCGIFMSMMWSVWVRCGEVHKKERT